MSTDQSASVQDAPSLPSFRALFLMTGAVALLVAADVTLWWFEYESLRNPFGVNLTLLAAVLGGGRIVYSAVSSLLDGDVGADLALAIAMLAALLLEEYWVGAEVVLIAMIGESLEAITVSRPKARRPTHTVARRYPSSTIEMESGFWHARRLSTEDPSLHAHRNPRSRHSRA